MKLLSKAFIYKSRSVSDEIITDLFLISIYLLVYGAKNFMNMKKPVS